MPPVSGASVTESAPKRRSYHRYFAVPLLAIVLILAVVVLLGIFSSRRTISLGSKQFMYERVATPESRKQGLSGRNGLVEGSAMLFEFDESGRHCIWMKDMQFSIDIIWLNERKEIVHAKENVSPDTYPQRFCPDRDSRYVIEINAGVYATTDAKLGDSVTF